MSKVPLKLSLGPLSIELTEDIVDRIVSKFLDGDTRLPVEVAIDGVFELKDPSSAVKHHNDKKELDD